MLDMLDAHTVPDPDTPSVDANAVRVLAGLLPSHWRCRFRESQQHALTACLQYPLPDPTHGG